MIFPHRITFLAPDPNVNNAMVSSPGVPALVMSSNPVNTNVETFQGLGTTLSGEWFDIYLTRKAYSDMIADLTKKRGNMPPTRSSVSIQNTPGEFNPFYESTGLTNVDGKVQGVSQFPGMVVMALQIISIDF